MQKVTAFLGALAILAGTAAIAAADTSMNKSPAPAKLSVAAKFSPDPPKQGAETIVVSVKDGTGTPLKGAVVKVASNMPTMSMGGPTVAAHDNKDGTYSATIKINFATTWTFDITASVGQRKGGAHLSADVK